MIPEKYYRCSRCGTTWTLRKYVLTPHFSENSQGCTGTMEKVEKPAEEKT